MYGAEWCGDCRRARRLLEDRRVAYEWIDLEARPEETPKARQAAGGRRNIPVIVFPDGSVLVEPTDQELEQALLRQPV